MFFHDQLEIGVIFKELNHADDVLVTDLLQEEDFVGQTLVLAGFHPAVDVHFRFLDEFGHHQFVGRRVHGQLDASESSTANVLDKLSIQQISNNNNS